MRCVFEGICLLSGIEKDILIYEEFESIRYLIWEGGVKKVGIYNFVVRNGFWNGVWNFYKKSDLGIWGNNFCKKYCG